MSPELRTPPSAITGMPWPASACTASYTAVTCGTPTPATTRVVQMLPGPCPTFTASAPASASAERAVAGRDVPRDELDVVLGLQLAHDLEDAVRMAVRRVHDEHVDLGVDERGCALHRVRPDADRRADAQPALVVLRRVRVLDRASRCP